MQINTEILSTQSNGEYEDIELSPAQVARNDEIYNAVYSLCCLMTENDNLEWDMSYIGQIADVAADLLTSKGNRVHFPSIVADEDGNLHVEEYY